VGLPLGLPEAPFLKVPFLVLLFTCFTGFFVLAAAKLITPLFEGYVRIKRKEGVTLLLIRAKRLQETLF
jgi:hypothetical protein